jgi:hypothetical protein
MKRSQKLEQAKLWAEISKRAYWNRAVELADWQSKTSQEHRSYLPQALQFFSAKEFVQLYGEEAFCADWPRLKAQAESLQPSLAQFFPLYDVRWSQLMEAGVNLRPHLWWFELSKREKEFLRCVSSKPGQSIYKTAKDLGMQYRRAHDYAQDLMQRGIVFARQETVSSRRQNRLYPKARMGSSHAPSRAIEHR